MYRTEVKWLKSRQIFRYWNGVAAEFLSSVYKDACSWGNVKPDRMDLKSMLWHSKPNQNMSVSLSLTFRRFWFIFSKLSSDSSREYFEQQVDETYRRVYWTTMNIKAQNSNSRLMTTGSLSFFLIVFCFTLWYISRSDEPVCISLDFTYTSFKMLKMLWRWAWGHCQFLRIFNTIPVDDMTFCKKCVFRKKISHQFISRNASNLRRDV